MTTSEENANASNQNNSANNSEPYVVVQNTQLSLPEEEIAPPPKLGILSSVKKCVFSPTTGLTCGKEMTDRERRRMVKINLFNRDAAAPREVFTSDGGSTDKYITRTRTKADRESYMNALLDASVNNKINRSVKVGNITSEDGANFILSGRGSRLDSYLMATSQQANKSNKIDNAILANTIKGALDLKSGEGILAKKITKSAMLPNSLKF
jgi:hypothetical protein